MLICVPNVLSKAEVAEFRSIMDAATWEDGRSTAGAQSALVKKNEQLPPNGEVVAAARPRVIKALTANPLFISAAIRCTSFRRCSTATATAIISACTSTTRCAATI